MQICMQILMSPDVCFNTQLLYNKPPHTQTRATPSGVCWVLAFQRVDAFLPRRVVNVVEVVSGVWVGAGLEQNLHHAEKPGKGGGHTLNNTTSSLQLADVIADMFTTVQTKHCLFFNIKP